MLAEPVDVVRYHSHSYLKPHGKEHLQLKGRLSKGAWVAQSVKRPTSAQVMISQFVGSSPATGSVLTARSLEPASDSASPSLSLPLPCLSSVSLALQNKY